MLRVAHSSTWLDTVLEDFQRQLIRQDRSPNTVRIYTWAIVDLFSLMRRAGMRNIAELDREVLEVWQDQLIARGMKPRSRSLAIVAIRQLIKWAAKRDLLSIKLEDALAKPKLPDLEPRPIPPEDLLKVRSCLFPARRTASLLELRDRAFFAFLLASGARASEALQVTRSNYTAAVVRQKGGSKKELLIPPAVAQMVAEYLAHRDDDLECCFASHRRGRTGKLTRGGALDIWRRLSRKLGIVKWTTHQIRHTTATELFDAEIPDAVISKHLGHKSLQMLAVYRKVRPAQRQRAVDAMAKLVDVPPAPVEVKPRSKRASWSRLGK